MRGVAKANRQTTLESLEGAINLIFAQNEKEFVESYNKATHDKCGHTIFTMMSKLYYKEKLAKEKEIKRRNRPNANRKYRDL